MESILARMADWVSKYALWLYLLSILALLMCIRDILIARREKKQTIFKLEREMATAREAQAISTAALLFGVIIAITAFKFGLVPSIQALPLTPTPTATSFLFQEPPTRAVSTPTATLPEPTPTRRRATPTPSLALPPTHTPLPPVVCPHPNVCIQYPLPNMPLRGVVEIRGTARMERFQFYKLEYGLGESPQQWHSVSDIHRQPVVNGVLDIWNITGFPQGVYKLRLTVVDLTGNYAPPHEIRVIIEK